MNILADQTNKDTRETKQRRSIESSTWEQSTCSAQGAKNMFHYKEKDTKQIIVAL
jgi:hypothetical protein